MIKFSGVSFIILPKLGEIINAPLMLGAALALLGVFIASR
jgi:hypothetical protein